MVKSITRLAKEQFRTNQVTELALEESRAAVARLDEQLKGASARADDQRAVVVDRDEYRRQLRAAVAAGGRQNAPMMLAHEGADVVSRHSAS